MKVPLSWLREYVSFDLPVEGWTINATGGPTELVLEIS